jgi:hypothetical protein
MSRRQEEHSQKLGAPEDWVQKKKVKKVFRRRPRTEGGSDQSKLIILKRNNFNLTGLTNSRNL